MKTEKKENKGLVPAILIGLTLVLILVYFFQVLFLKIT